MAVPNVAGSASPLERIGEHTSEQRRVGEKNVTFIIELARHDCLHPCSIDDVSNLLALVPASDWAGIETIVFRQPTRKQAIVNPAWGRLLYFGEVSGKQRRAIATGPMILLDAIEENFAFKWSTNLTPGGQAELDRLRADGHQIERDGAHYAIHTDPASTRNTQLYRTMLHEIGHWFDWLEKVEAPAMLGGDFEDLTARYFSRPLAERESFAHRYADETRNVLMSKGKIPFEPQKQGIADQSKQI